MLPRLPGDQEIGSVPVTGPVLNRCARLIGVAHGGQILVSGLTQGHLEDDPLTGIALRDLGEHRLKDLSAPVRIYQSEAYGLA